MVSSIAGTVVVISALNPTSGARSFCTVSINGEIIPALDTVGRGFEEKRVYLPQLLMSAEAAKSAFEEIKAFIARSEKEPAINA